MCQQLYSLAVEKRGLIAYHDKRELLNDLVNGHQNPNTHAYCNYLLVDEVQVEKEVEPAATGINPHIVTCEQRHEARIVQAHALAVYRARHRIPDDSLDVDKAKI